MIPPPVSEDGCWPKTFVLQVGWNRSGGVLVWRASWKLFSVLVIPIYKAVWAEVFLVNWFITSEVNHVQVCWTMKPRMRECSIALDVIIGILLVTGMVSCTCSQYWIIHCWGDEANLLHCPIIEGTFGSGSWYTLLGRNAVFWWFGWNQGWWKYSYGSVEDLCERTSLFNWGRKLH